MASASDYSSGSEDDTPIAKKKKSTGAKTDNDDFSFKNVLRPPRSTTYTAQALYDQIIEGVIDLDPYYQRDVVWSEIKQIGLIDSVFRNFYIPPIIFAVSQSPDGTERRVCIDGKQRLTSIQKFMDGLVGLSSLVLRTLVNGSLPDRFTIKTSNESKRKYWYKQKAGKPGKQLPPKYKRMFANKQIVCIEYMEITGDDEREIFRAEAPTPRQTLVHELVSDFAMSLRNLGFNDRRDAGFRWIAQSLQTLLDPRPILKRSSTTYSQQATWLKDTAPLDPAWKKKIQHTYKLLVDTLVTYPNCLKVTRGPTTIAPIDLVMMVLLVFEFQEKLSASRLADALHALRMAARKETKDLMWKSEHMGHYAVFLDRLERLGEGALGPSSVTADDAPVVMDMDPPAKRQRTGDYSSVSQSSPAKPQRVSINIPLGKQQPSSSSPSTPRPKAVPFSSSTHAPTSPSPNPGSTPASKSLAALESMLTTLASRPSQKVDRLSALRAAKAAIQGGQQQPQQAPQSRPGPHPLPPRPSVAPVMAGPGPSGPSDGNGPGGKAGPSM
ncbi:hypothetical protein BGY98DRAFT_1098601 [Russula aff. rugulosa BPL654]|nr:hypothetical protein BGY98DRAFT_1098601 [Russula aff. rugulosa BPL654]